MANEASQARAFAERFRGKCDYVYRHERDETARLLDFLVDNNAKTEALIVKLEQGVLSQKEFNAQLNENLAAARNEVESSKKRIEAHKKMQKTYLKFAKRNIQQFKSFAEGEVQELTGNVISINGDALEESINNLYKQLPDSNFIEFLAHNKSEMDLLIQGVELLKVTDKQA